MRNDDLDRILSREEEITPSSGFAASVMDAVRAEASVPPIPFPWKRALPGLAALGFSLVWLLIAAIKQLGEQAAAPPIKETLSSMLAPLLASPMSVAVGWTIVALLLTLACVKLSIHLAGGNT